MKAIFGNSAFIISLYNGVTCLQLLIEIKEFDNLQKYYLTCSTLYSIEFLWYPLEICWGAKKIKGNSLIVQYLIAYFGPNIKSMDSVFFCVVFSSKRRRKSSKIHPFSTNFFLKSGKKIDFWPP